MIRIRRSLMVVPAIAVVMMLHACDGPAPLEPLPIEPRLAESSDPSLIYCPGVAAEKNAGLVSILGGEVELDQHRLDLGLASVLTTTLVSIRTPASQHMLVELHANGLEHFEFLRPVRVTIDYSRCSTSEIERGPLSVWYVDDAGNMLENMGGVDNREARTITFYTDHFSGYAIAN